MSINYNAYVKYEPYVQEKIRALLGRWTCANNFAGDASGGTITVDCVFAGRSPFGQHAVFDWKIFSWRNSVVIAAGNYVTTHLIPWELVAGAEVIEWYRQWLMTTYNLTNQNINLPDFKYRLSVTQSNPSTIQLVAPNQDATGYIFTLGGYIYDERYL